jgi:hypothetical protein
MLPDRVTPVEAARPVTPEFSATAAFFDLDKTLIARSSTPALALVPPHGLRSRTGMDARRPRPAPLPGRP